MRLRGLALFEKVDGGRCCVLDDRKYLSGSMALSSKMHRTYPCRRRASSARSGPTGRAQKIVVFYPDSPTHAHARSSASKQERHAAWVHLLLLAGGSAIPPSQLLLLLLLLLYVAVDYRAISPTSRIVICFDAVLLFSCRPPRHCLVTILSPPTSCLPPNRFVGT